MIKNSFFIHKLAIVIQSRQNGNVNILIDEIYKCSKVSVKL